MNESINKARGKIQIRESDTPAESNGVLALCDYLIGPRMSYG